MKYTKTNEAFWDAQSKNNDVWTVPLSREAYRQAVAGALEVYLTPAKPVPADWFPALKGAKVLGLASGGGQQGPVFAAHGADVTIMDISDKQLETEGLVAKREGYPIHLVKADMTERFPFGDGFFDLIFHPVANCYVQDIQHVWNECARVLKKGGALLSGFCKEELFLFEFDLERNPPLVVSHPLPNNPLKNENPMNINRGPVFAFSHTLEEQIGGQINAGFALQGIYDDRDREGVFAQYMNTYAATKSVKL